MSDYRVPLRVSFTGMGTDIPSRIRYNTGMSISCVIDKYVHVKITTNNHEPPLIYPECDLICSLLKKLPFEADIPNMQIKWHSDIPLGMGLGSSSALLVALSKHFFANPSYQAYFVSALEIERGAGWQDAAICAYGGCRMFNFRHDRFTLSQSFRLPDDRYFMLVSLKQSHDTAKQYKTTVVLPSETIKSNKKRVLQFAKALREDDYQLVGNVMNETYMIRCNAKNYATKEMQAFHLSAINEGAHGGLIMGSGGGGHFLFSIDPMQRANLIELAEQFGYNDIPFNFVSAS